MKQLYRIIRLTSPFKKWVLLNLMFNLLGMLFSIFSFAMVIPLLRVLFNTDPEAFQKIIDQHQQLNFGQLSTENVTDQINFWMANLVLTEGKQAALLLICGGLASAVFLKNLFTYLSSVFLSLCVHAVTRNNRNLLFSKVLSLQLAFFSDEKKGDLLTRFTTDLREIEIALMNSINAFFKQPFYIIGYILTLFIINAELSLFILIFLPFSGAIIALIGKGLKKRARDGQAQTGDLLSMTEETLSGLRIIRGFNAESEMRQKFEAKSHNLFKLMVRIFRKVDIASPASEFLGVVATCGVLLYGGKLVFAGTLAPDFFIGYLILFSQLITPFKEISKATYEANRGVAALGRIEEITKAPVEINDGKEGALRSFENAIRYRNVNFKYGEDYVLKNISFEIKKGRSVALVGQSGSGKSTIADLLPRFYEVEEGGIFMDDQNIKAVSLNSLRHKLGIVTQQSILFNDTVFNNISFGSEGKTRDEVMLAAQMANAHDFIMQLEKGYETNIGDSGNKLSGGQKQRLSIARALLKNPDVLILDEATSALDTESEKLVQDALNRLMKNRTSLVIAHRLSTIQHCDEILVMHAGEIIERGTHQELLALGGTYKKLIEMQQVV